ncbi:MAG: globin domain-containing protein [Rhodospirillaceae bacterium]
MEVSPQDQMVIQASFAVTEGGVEALAETFHAKLTGMDPSLPGPYAGDLRAFSQNFLATLSDLVDNLYSIGSMRGMLHDMGVDKAENGLRDDHYDTFGAALLAAFEDKLGSNYTPDVAAA